MAVGFSGSKGGIVNKRELTSSNYVHLFKQLIQ